MTWAAQATGRIRRPGGATAPETRRGTRTGAVLAIWIALCAAGIGAIVAMALPATAATSLVAAGESDDAGDLGDLISPGLADSELAAGDAVHGDVADTTRSSPEGVREGHSPDELEEGPADVVFGTCPITELQKAWGPLEPQDRLTAEEEAIRLCTERSRAIADLVDAEQAARTALERARAERLDVETSETQIGVAEQRGLGSLGGSGPAADAAQPNTGGDDDGDGDSGRGSTEGDYGHLPTVGPRLLWEEDAEPGTGEGAYPAPSVGALIEDQTEWSVLLTARAGDGQWRARIVGARQVARDVPIPAPAPAPAPALAEGAPGYGDSVWSDTVDQDGNADWDQGGGSGSTTEIALPSADATADFERSAGSTQSSPSGAVSDTGTQAAGYRRTWFTETVGPRVVTLGADLGSGRKVSGISATGVTVSIPDHVTGSPRTASLPWSRTGPATVPATLAWEFGPVEEMELAGRAAAAGIFGDDDPWADDPAWETIGPTEPGNGPGEGRSGESGVAAGEGEPGDRSLRDDGSADRGAESGSVHSAEDALVLESGQ